MRDNKTLRGVGTQMSNVLYNLFQRPGTITVDEDRVKMVQELVKNWDEVIKNYFNN